MSMTDAPFFAENSPGPDDAQAWWVTTQDNVRLRVACWGRAAEKGTVLLFPGRTEYVEKYGPAATDLAERGYCTFAIDWRGQGLAARALNDRRIGHVGSFEEYQHDVAAAVKAARQLDLPKPWYLLAHSMGGCIGLRAVYENLPVAAAAFSAPMWGIEIAPPLRPVAWVLTRLMPAIGQGGALAPTTLPEPYVLAAPFEDNKLTTDATMHSMMRQQVSDHPDLCLGGPSFSWLGKAIKECNALSGQPAPKLPCVAFLGSNERIVNSNRVIARIKGWSGAELNIVQGGEHEVLMEQPQHRKMIFDKLANHFAMAA